LYGNVGGYGSAVFEGWDSFLIVSSLFCVLCCGGAVTDCPLGFVHSALGSIVDLMHLYSIKPVLL
jgi:hypothetical protein